MKIRDKRKMNIHKKNIENSRTKSASSLKNKKSTKNKGKKFANNAVSETGGPKGPEPTRYGDWEQNGRCTDF